MEFIKWSLKLILRSYLEAILLCKLDDGFSSVPCGICCIKHLRRQEKTIMKRSHIFAVRLFCMQTSWKLSGTHRNLTSFNAQVLANIIECWHSTMTVNRHTFFVLSLFIYPSKMQSDVQNILDKLTCGFLTLLHYLDGKTQRTCRSSGTPSGSLQRWTLLQMRQAFGFQTDNSWFQC